MKELLEQLDFRFIGLCACLGPRTYKYKKAQYTVYWIPKFKKFKIKYRGKTITPLHDEKDFEQVIQAEISQLSS